MSRLRLPSIPPLARQAGRTQMPSIKLLRPIITAPIIVFPPPLVLVVVAIASAMILQKKIIVPSAVAGQKADVIVADTYD